MHWLIAFHIIAMVAWFAGLFYLPRIFVYHAMEHSKQDTCNTFKVMERKLYFGIMWPAALATSFSGIWLLSQHWHYYFHAPWMLAKLACVILLWLYHLSCGYYRRQLAKDYIAHGHVFFRFFNEVPTLLLIAIILLVVVR